MHTPLWPESLFKPAAALADPSRAVMLAALMDGLALPAGDLARMAGIGASTASAHLNRLVDAGFVSVTRQGRHRYYQLASAEVAEALEAMAGLMPQAPTRARHGDPSLWQASSAWPCANRWSNATGCSSMVMAAGSAPPGGTRSRP